jgi:hypothetical protein
LQLYNIAYIHLGCTHYVQITYCVTAATIEKVKSTRHGWYYFACHKCPKIAKGDNAPYTCEDGHNTETEIVK